MTTHRFDPDLGLRVAALLRSGLNYADIAERFGWTMKRARNFCHLYCKDAVAQLREQRDAERAKLHAKIIQLNRDGLSRREIAAALHIRQTRVNYEIDVAAHREASPKSDLDLNPQNDPTRTSRRFPVMADRAVAISMHMTRREYLQKLNRGWVPPRLAPSRKKVMGDLKD